MALRLHGRWPAPCCFSFLTSATHSLQRRRSVSPIISICQRTQSFGAQYKAFFENPLKSTHRSTQLSHKCTQLSTSAHFLPRSRFRLFSGFGQGDFGAFSQTCRRRCIENSLSGAVGTCFVTKKVFLGGGMNGENRNFVPENGIFGTKTAIFVPSRGWRNHLCRQGRK